jgi:glycosyltransferase involved in cell wall biosynthesis
MLNLPPYDLAFVLGNEIFPPVGRLAKQNIFICQFPFPFNDTVHKENIRPFWNDFDLVLTYSEFVRRHMTAMIMSENLPSIPIEILEPPVPMLSRSCRKRAQILSVGRFFTGGHCKRHDVLIEAIRALSEQGVDVELHLAGSLHPEAEHRSYYMDLLERSVGLPVSFHVNCSAKKLQELYMESRIYWHATGFGHDPQSEPHLTEHFGITVVEAMSAGCIPIVFAAGGPAEIVENGVTGFHFNTVDELCACTKMILTDSTSETLEMIANAAALAAQAYSETIFKARIRNIAGRFLTSSGKEWH